MNVLEQAWKENEHDAITKFVLSTVEKVLDFDEHENLEVPFNGTFMAKMVAGLFDFTEYIPSQVIEFEGRSEITFPAVLFRGLN